MDANVESLYNLEENLQTQGYDLMKLPYVLQLNKRDLPNVIPVEDLTAELRRKQEPVVEAIAFQRSRCFRYVEGRCQAGPDGTPQRLSPARFQISDCRLQI